MRHRRAARRPARARRGDPCVLRRRSTTSRRWGGAHAHTPRPRPTARSPSRGTAAVLEDVRAWSLKVVFWDLRRRARVDARGVPARRAGARAGPTAAGARRRGRLPTVAVIVAAYDEESVIERRRREPARARLPVRPARDRRHLRRVDRPDGRARRTGRRPRDPQSARRQGGGAGQRRARDRAATSSPSPTRTAPGRPTRCASSSAPSPTRDVAYVCGRLNLQADDGRNKEGALLALRARAARRRVAHRLRHRRQRLDLRGAPRTDYLEVDPRFGHDLSFPYLMVQRGKRAVYEPEANAYEKATPTNEDEYRRKVRMFEHCWAIVVEGKMLRRLRPLYLVEVRLAPAPSLRERPAARRAARLHDRAVGAGRVPGRARAAARRCSPLPRSASASRATTCSSRGRRWWRS